jgi:hypothetical protein
MRTVNTHKWQVRIQVITTAETDQKKVTQYTKHRALLMPNKNKNQDNKRKRYDTRTAQCI